MRGDWWVTNGLSFKDRLMRKLNISTKMVIVLLSLVFGFYRPPLHGEDELFVVHDRYGVPMVFVPSGVAQIGATVDEAAEKCDELRVENNISRVRSCRRALTTSTPDGIDLLVTPVTEVSFEDYFIDQYEVTIQSYQVCVDDSVCSSNVIQYVQEFSPYQSVDEPIRYISYLDAATYCSWRGGYVPSEAEWEYAARSPERLAFPWGNEFDGNIVNFCDSNCQVPAFSRDLWDDSFASIAPVTAHLQDISWVGAIGMAGNVSEWTSTVYISPNLTTASPLRVIKGGDFGSPPDQTLLWRRFSLSEGEIREGVGFRCAKRL